MTSRKRTVAITGSTGQQGGALARRMLDHGHRVRVDIASDEPKRFADLDPMLGRLFAAIDGPMLGGPMPGAGAGAGLPKGPPPRVDLRALHADYPELGWHSFADWVAEQDWPRLLDGAEVRHA